MTSSTLRRAASLPTTPFVVPVPNTSGVTRELKVVENFAIFIDTHRDQPHVPTFEDDIHRGWCRPTLVHYAPPESQDPDDWGLMVRTEDRRVIAVHPKHKFVEYEWWTSFITDWFLVHGTSPIAADGEQKGQLPTTHLRDSHRKVYFLKSLRQVVKAHQDPNATVKAVTYTPNRRGKRAAAAAAQ